MKFKNDVEIQNSDLTISNTGSAHLILNGDSNNSGDTGQEDAIIDFLGDAGDYGYRLNSENYSQKSAFNIQENRDSTYTSRLYIDEDGDVGIGTTSPDSNLEVAGSTGSNTVLHVRNDSTGSTRLKFSNSTDTNANGFQIINNAFNGSVNLLNYKATPLALWTNSSQRLTILSNGNVGIGTTDPKVLLHLRKDTATAGSESIILLDNRQGPSTSNYYSGGLWGAGYRDVANPGYLAGIDFLRTSQSGGLSSQGEMIFYTTTIASTLSSIRASNERMRIDSIGNVGIGTTDPTSKLHISSSTSTDTPTAGTTNGGLFISNASRTYGLNLGVQNTGRSWIQGQRMDGNTSLYDLLLQPLGGNVGIGTDSPGAKLEVYGSSPNILINNTTETDSGIVFTDAQAGTSQRAAIKFSSADNKLKFFVNDEVAQRMVIDTAGYVGIGTTNPGKLLEVSGGANEACLRLRDTASNYWDIQNTTFGKLDFSRGGTFRMRIDQNGSLSLVSSTALKGGGGSWGTYSDERVKKDVSNYTKGLNEILAIKPITYKYNGKANLTSEKQFVGIIAQEIKEVLPSTVEVTPTKLNDEDEFDTDLLTFDASELTFTLINAVKELKAEIEELKKQINK